MKYRKKPVVIEAVQWNGDNRIDFVGWLKGGYMGPGSTLMIPTLEGLMQASPGDYIIKGVKGEFYPCKPDIFEETHEPVTLDSAEETERELKQERDALREQLVLMARKTQDRLAGRVSEEMTLLKRYVAGLEFLLREAQDSVLTYSRCPECGRLVACSGVPCRAGHCACGYNVTESEIETVDVAERVAELEARVNCAVRIELTDGYILPSSFGGKSYWIYYEAGYEDTPGKCHESDNLDALFAKLTELGLWPVKGGAE